MKLAGLLYCCDGYLWQLTTDAAPTIVCWSPARAATASGVLFTEFRTLTCD